jgi:hypothetical protein
VRFVRSIAQVDLVAILVTVKSLAPAPALRSLGGMALWSCTRGMLGTFERFIARIA